MSKVVCDRLTTGGNQEYTGTGKSEEIAKQNTAVWLPSTTPRPSFPGQGRRQQPKRGGDRRSRRIGGQEDMEDKRIWRTRGYRRTGGSEDRRIRGRIAGGQEDLEQGEIAENYQLLILKIWTKRFSFVYSMFLYYLLAFLFVI